MKLTANILARVLLEITTNTKASDLDSVLDNFSKFLIAHSWSSDSKVKKIFSVYKTIQSISGNKQEVTIKTARPLTLAEKDLSVTMAKKICNKNIELNILENKNLLGGIILEGYDWRYCADVKSNLEKLRANLISG